MTRYRRTWLSVYRSVAALGACIAVIMYPFTSTIALWCTGAAIGAVITYAIHPAPNTTPLKRARLRRAAINALSAGVVVLAVAGLTGVVHTWVWPLMVLAVATSPWAIDLFLRHASSGLPKAPVAAEPVATKSVPAETGRLPDIPVEADVFTSAVRTLADGDLCRAWRGSFQWLEGSHSVALHAYVVALRQAYMDELDRRDHAGFQAWLESCPRPRGGPEKFLHHGTDDHHSAP